MKSPKCFLVIPIFIFFISCKQADAVPYFGIEFLFKESQPINDREIRQLPNKFLGNYISSDSTYLIIKNQVIYYKWSTKNNISFSDFKSLKDSLRIVDNKLFIDDQFVEFRKLKDSIEITNTNYDTIFSISDSNKAKRVKGSIVLNTKDSIFWKIKIMSLNKKTLSLMTLVSDEDLTRLDSLSKVKVQKIDSTKNVFELSKTEFKKMLALKRLGFIQEYKKLD